LSFDWLSERDRSELLDFFAERFGIGEEVFKGYRFFQKGEYINIVGRATAEAADELDGLDAGLQLVKLTRSGQMKPVTRGIQAFGATATSNVVDVGEEEIKAMVQGRIVPAEGLHGFVILRHKGSVLGVGLCREGRLEGQLPRMMTDDLVLYGG